MIETLQGELYVAPPETNQVEQVIAEQFDDPELWSREQPVRMRAGSLAGLKRSRQSDTSYSCDGPAEEHWVTLLYGSRVIDAGSPRWGVVEFETTPLEIVPEIHARLTQTVLAGEHARPSVFVDPPVAKWQAMGRDPKNNLFWLREIERGVWPIMANGVTYRDGRKAYFAHDYGDYHTALCMLLPRETQDLITQVAHHEAGWYERHMDGEVPRQLRLPGDTDKDPFSVWSPGNGPYKDGMNIIDHLTETEAYVHLLHYLMHGESTTPEARLATVEAYTRAGREDYASAIDQAATGLRAMKAYTGMMQNFIFRHEHGHNTTQELVDAEFEQFKTGVLRVAKKILGEYHDEEKVEIEPVRSRPHGSTPVLGRLATHETSPATAS